MSDTIKIVLEFDIDPDLVENNRDQQVLSYGT